MKMLAYIETVRAGELGFLYSIWDCIARAAISAPGWLFSQAINFREMAGWAF